MRVEHLLKMLNLICIKCCMLVAPGVASADEVKKAGLDSSKSLEED